MLAINKKRCKAFALACASKRAHKFTRVSADFYARADANLKAWMLEHIASLPSKGKTI